MKFSSSDIDERAYWDDYMEAYETCINRTARKNTPWYVVPADHKWYARLVISRIVLDELRNMNPQWPVLSEEEKNRLAAYREVLIAESVPREEEEDSEPDMKVKPSDTAVGIALKSDRQALSEKKFRKLLKKSVFDNFCERFGVSEQTQEELGKIYLDYEELEAKAEADDLQEIKSFYKEKKAALGAELKGFGKEARKLYERYKKVSATQIDVFADEVNVAYAKYEENLKQFMAEYELAVGAQEIAPEEALTDYANKVLNAFEDHRCCMEESLEATENRLEQIAYEYSVMGQAFRTVKKCEEDADEAEETETEDDEQLGSEEEPNETDEEPDTEDADGEEE